MEQQDPFKIGQLSKELVAGRLAGIEDPCAAAADTIKKTLVVALKAMPDGDSRRAQAIEEAVRGGLQGVILGDHDFAKAGMLTLQGMADLAMDMHLDPTGTLEAVLRGFAGLKRLVAPQKMDSLRHAIDAEYMGAGMVLSELLSRQPDPGRREQGSPAS
ncbi:MAG: hypothetical protein HY928_10820 [Elusimicrobia bacterium]|nr:hypothetical protein [Elusimicrobiota bacterium]